MGYEIVQFALALAGLVVVGVIWYVVVFRSGRTMENGWRRDDETD